LRKSLIALLIVVCGK